MCLCQAAAAVSIMLTDLISYRLEVITPFHEYHPHMALWEAILFCKCNLLRQPCRDGVRKQFCEALHSASQRRATRGNMHRGIPCLNVTRDTGGRGLNAKV